MITAKIIADSVNVETKKRITSFLLVYPRFIHAELMTHRAFNRNAASSRAIPFSKMVKMIQENIAGPIHWGAEQKGMQSGGEVEGINKSMAISEWQKACSDAMEHATMMSGLGVHKSICNRLLEPFAHMTTLVTATEYVNFFNLRAEKQAMPEFQELAYQMLDLYVTNKPKELKPGEWHLPYCDAHLETGMGVDLMLKISTARAARTSYLTMENKIDIQKDFELHDGLLKNKHLSPFEHAAQACHATNTWETDTEFGGWLRDRDNNRIPILHGNMHGWKPYRKFIKDENMTKLTSTPRCFNGKIEDEIKFLLDRSCLEV